MFSDLLVPGASSGLAALATYDSNSDGKITAADAGFDDVKVWEPGAGGSAGNLYTLRQLGISEIGLNGTAIDAMDNGNEILNGFTFKYADGAIGQGAEVGFAAGPDLTPADLQLSRLIHAMASLPGAGAIPTTAGAATSASEFAHQNALAVHH